MKNHYEIIIIGAGAGGLSSAIFAAKNKKTNILILEKTDTAGNKILVSGGSRCNILPEIVTDEDYFSDSPKVYLKHILKSWSLEDCYSWITKEIGISLKKEEDKYFPANDSGKKVRNIFLEKVESLGVEIQYNKSVESITKKKDSWVCKTETGETYTCDKLIIASGGLSFPKLGTTGACHDILEKLGHKVNKTYPALTSLKGDHLGYENLSGLSLDVELTVKFRRKKVKAKRTGFLFTHTGYSGPAIMDMSHYAINAIKNGLEKPEFIINWNGISEEDWEKILQRENILVFTKLKEYMPSRLARAICEETELMKRKLSELRKEEQTLLIEFLTNYKLPYKGYYGYDKAEVTGGGVALEEINTGTLESKVLPDIYLCGEVLDTFGRIGGFNFYWAWLTGRLAGISATQ